MRRQCISDKSIAKKKKNTLFTRASSGPCQIVPQKASRSHPIHCTQSDMTFNACLLGKFFIKRTKNEKERTFLVALPLLWNVLVDPLSDLNKSNEPETILICIRDKANQIAGFCGMGTIWFWKVKFTVRRKKMQRQITLSKNKCSPCTVWRYHAPSIYIYFKVRWHGWVVLTWCQIFEPALH